VHPGPHEQTSSPETVAVLIGTQQPLPCHA
jgi:hypothetical protein